MKRFHLTRVHLKWRTEVLYSLRRARTPAGLQAVRWTDIINMVKVVEETMRF